MNQTQNTENAILQAAEKLFKENGFTRTTTPAIAREAGVTHAMLHYYFRTKEQIFLQVLDGYIKEMHEDFKAVMKPGEDALTTIREVASRHFDFMEQHQGQMKVLLEVSEQQPEIIGRYREGFTRMASTALRRHQERLDEAAARGEIARVKMVELLCDIVMNNYATFALLPLVRNALQMDETTVKTFLEARKRSSVEAVCNRLQIKN